MDVKEETWFKAAAMTHPEEKSAVLHFYVQDFRAGSGPGDTVYVVAESSISATSPTNFGEMHVTDDLITTQPEVNSEVIGKAQGTTISADFLVSGEQMYLNFYFTAGEYAGSSLTMLGRNEIMNEEREMPIVGGTGFFRLARGYAL
ncbi:dirigent protein 21-like [Salvia splendens]|nr:dirigent protein 21-like [Salvia splendens]